MQRERFYKGRGVVLHTIKYGDSSLIAHVLTDCFGRQSYMVRGVRSQKGRGSKAALFQPLFTLEFEAEIPKQSRGDLHYFKEIRTARVLSKTPFDIKRSTIALFIAEMLYRLVQESETNLNLFDFTWGAVEALDTIEDGVGLANFHLWFMANLSRELGYVPTEIYRDGFWFNIAEGHYTEKRPIGQLSLSPKISEVFAMLLNLDVQQLSELKIGRETRIEVLEGFVSFYGYHLDAVHNIQSIKILQELF